MHQRDYILRVIEQLGAALAELRRRIVGGEPSEGLRQDLARVAGQAGFDIEILRGFDLASLTMLVAPTGEVELARCWLMAEVLYLDGLEASLRGEDAFESLMKARALYDLIRPAGGMIVGLPEAGDRIAEIDRRLQGGEADETGGSYPSRRMRARRMRAATARGAFARG